MMNPIHDILDYHMIQKDKFLKKVTYFSMMELVKEVFDIIGFQDTDLGLNFLIENNTK